MGFPRLEGEGISIHTPARGVTHKVTYFSFKDVRISIHTPARGVTPIQ